MLEGLEISVLKLSELERTIRFDSEFYKTNDLKTIEILKQKKYKLLTDYVSVSDGNHMSISENFSEKGVPYYRGQDVHDFFIEQSNPICIDESTFNKPVMERSHLRKGDLLLSIVGTIGKLSLVYSNKKQTCSCKLAILRPNISAEFLAIILTSRYGQIQIQRLTRGAVQMGLILEDMNQILIPILYKSFQTEIEKIVKQSHNNLEQSKTLYTQAEQLLLEELGFNNFPKVLKLSGSCNSSIKTFKESYQTSSRLDAEYYQPKYDEYLTTIQSNKNGCELIGTICSLNDNNFNPDNNVEYKYIELADIGSSGEIKGCTIDIGINLPTRARRIVKQNQLVISSIEGSLQSCALVTQDYDNALCSTGFYIIESKKINSETLLVLFKTSIIQALLKKGCSGTILTGITKDEFLNIPLPIISSSTQTQISTLIQQSFQLRQQSKQLLEIAKQAVETAIEQNETVATNFIQANT